MFLCVALTQSAMADVGARNYLDSLFYSAGANRLDYEISNYSSYGRLKEIFLFLPTGIDLISYRPDNTVLKELHGWYLGNNLLLDIDLINHSTHVARCYSNPQLCVMCGDGGDLLTTQVAELNRRVNNRRIVLLQSHHDNNLFNVNPTSRRYFDSKLELLSRLFHPMGQDECSYISDIYVPHSLCQFLFVISALSGHNLIVPPIITMSVHEFHSICDWWFINQGKIPYSIVTHLEDLWNNSTILNATICHPDWMSELMNHDATFRKISSNISQLGLTPINEW